MDIEGAHFVAQLKSPEAREAFTAFAEKRPPDFSKLR
jgi:1,4-dihydroxy-2-naphthoyl-CoA synthase